jgi:hypothetical protein
MWEAEVKKSIRPQDRGEFDSSSVFSYLEILKKV